MVIGRHAQAGHLPETMKLSLGNTMRDWRWRWPGVILLPHPSARNAGWFRRTAWFEESVLHMLKTRVAEPLGIPSS